MRLTVLLLVVSALLAGACGTDGAEPEATADPEAMPFDLVAVRQDGFVAQLLSETGEEVRRVARDAETSERGGIALRPDRRVVYFVRPLTGGELELVQIPIEGGGSEPIAKGFAPAFHPDGKRVAYISSEDPRRPHELFVKDIEADTAQAWRLEEGTRPPPDAVAMLADVVWADGGSRLAYRVVFPDRSQLFRIDPQTAIPLLEGEAIPMSQENATPTALSARSRPGDIAWVEGCCLPNPGSYRVVVSGAEGASTLRDLAGPVASIDFDPSGLHMLFVRDGVLYRVSEGEAEPTMVAEGVVTAAW